MTRTTRQLGEAAGPLRTTHSGCSGGSGGKLVQEQKEEEEDFERLRRAHDKVDWNVSR